MWIVESDGPPSWSLDEYKMPVGRRDGVKSIGVRGWKKTIFSPAVPSTTPTHRYFVLSPVSLMSRDQDSSPSDSTIDIYDLTEK